jgi:subtilisin family serine protease
LSDLEWSTLKSAADWAYDNYADIYNWSGGTQTGGQWNNDYCKYFDHIAYEWHRLPVCAAGNIKVSGEYVVSPANAFNVLAVGGIDDKNTESWGDDTFWLEPDDGSGWRNPVDGREKPEVCAPAKDIVTTAPGGWATGSGTSAAAPQVAGIAAQLLEQDQSLVYWPELTKAIIMASAIHNVVPNTIEYDEDPNVVYHPYFYPVDKYEGVGTVDAYAAYQCVEEGDYTLQWRPNDDPFYIAQFHADAGQKVRFAINWLAHTDYNGGGDYGLYADFNLRVYSPMPIISYYSSSHTNPWEIVEFTAPLSGTYKARVTAPRFDGDEEWVAAAWYIW